VTDQSEGGSQGLLPKLWHYSIRAHGRKAEGLWGTGQSKDQKWN